MAGERLSLLNHRARPCTGQYNLAHTDIISSIMHLPALYEYNI